MNEYAPEAQPTVEPDQSLKIAAPKSQMCPWRVPLIAANLLAETLTQPPVHPMFSHILLSPQITQKPQTHPERTFIISVLKTILFRGCR